MSFKKINKIILRKLGYFALLATRYLIRVLPGPLYRAFKRVLILIGRPFLDTKKKTVLDNMNTVFAGQKSSGDIKRIAEQSLIFSAEEMIELLHFINRPQQIIQRVSIEGQEHVDRALQQGKGAILLSAHFGNFALMLCRMVLAGYKTNCIARRTRDEHFERFITQLRDLRGFKAIYAMPRRQCIAGSIQCLRDNELLTILFDQNFGDQGQVFVDFFGRKAATATGPVVLSQRTGAPVLPTFIIREAQGRYRIKIEEPAPLSFKGEGHMEVVNNVTLLTKIIEKYVSRYPAQWSGWMHQRWKSRPIPGKDYQELRKK